MASNSSPPDPDYVVTAQEWAIHQPDTAQVYALLALNKTLQRFLDVLVEADARDQP